MEATKGSSVELLIFEAPRAINVFLKVYYEIHYKLMSLVGGEFGCHCNAKGSEEEYFCTRLS
jgi:hypothetical protein